MKKNKLIFIATLSATCLFSLASCQGAQGPKGDTGEPGINGTNGVNGTDGKNGSSVLTGKGEPASTLGSDGDSYIDTDTFDFYSKADGKWSKIGNIKGNTGEQGSEGEQGKPGKDGTSLLTGNGAPANELGSDGDSYVDLDTFDFYKKADGAWSKYGNMKGADGSQGEAGEAGKTGTSVLTGKGEPASTLGNDGDSYIDTSSFDFYSKADGKWSKVGNIKGEKGDQGEKGDKGNTGWSGSKGDKGNTAWSNTILPSSGGYITVDVGSATTGTEVTFTAHAEGNNVVSLFQVKYLGDVIKEGSSTTENELKLTTTMQDGGFVVSAKFTDATTALKQDVVSAGNTTYDSFNEAIKAGATSIKLLKDAELTESINVLEDATLEIDLNGHKLDCKNNQIGVLGTLNFINDGQISNAVTGSNITGIVTVGSKVQGTNYEVKKQTASFKLDGGKFNTISTMSKTKNTASGANTVSIGDKVIFKLSEDASTGSTSVPAITSSASDVKISVNSGAKFETSEAIKVSGGSATISGTINTNSTAVSVSGTSKIVAQDLKVEPSNDTVKDNIKAVEVTGGTVALSGSVSASSGTTVAVTDATSVTVDAKVTASSNAKAVEVTTGSVTVSGSVSSASGDAVEVKGGTVEVSGSVTSTSGSAVKASDGQVTVKATASVSTSSSTSAAVEISDKAAVTVSGTVEASNGTAVSVSGSASLEVKNEDNTEKKASISGSESGVAVSGGTVTVTSGTVSADSKDGAAINVDSKESSNITVTVSDDGKVESNSGSAVKQTGSGSGTVTVDVSSNAVSTGTTYYSSTIDANSKVELKKNEDGNKVAVITVTSDTNISDTVANALNKSLSLDSSIKDVVVNLPATSEGNMLKLKDKKLKPTLSGKSITFVGTKDSAGNPATTYDTKYTDGKTGEYGAEYTFDHTTSVTFENMNFELGFHDYTGFIGGKDYTFNNCHIKGMLSYCGKNGTSTFNKCTFEDSTGTPNKDSHEYLMWTYGQSNYKFEGCTFRNNTVGRYFNVTYCSGTVNIDISNCKFYGPGQEYGKKAILSIKLGENDSGTNWVINWNNNTIDDSVVVAEKDKNDYNLAYYDKVFGLEKQYTKDYQKYEDTKITVDGVLKFDGSTLKE